MIEVKSFNLDALGYIPIYSPRHAYKVEIVNASDVMMNLRSNPTDATTGIDMLPGEAKTFTSTKNTAIYDPSQVLFYAALASGTGVVKVIAH